ncbi:large conductance mechanosensitive channel protein MscL [Arthrobacter sp. JSM 101049]|uniref:large conductance mechanosensitive channel protein MscL n=1 Tax=Arthrobacter sp. JSM 101049 TaxID=929097 RepID=UPI003562D0F4
MLQGFKQFIMKGNVVDLAVAVVIGGAFATVIDALVNSVLMPLISVLVGTPNFDNFLAVGPEHAIKFGVLLTAIVNFLLVAAAIYFVVVMPMNVIIERRNARLAAGQPAEEEEVDAQVLLLTEIRDSLKSRG